MIGTITDTSKIASYQPTDEIKQLTKLVKQDYQEGDNIQSRPWQQFNDMSLIQRVNNDQKLFMSYVEPKSSDPDEAWRENTVRPLTRNKVMSMAAHLTASLLYPRAIAQDDNDDEDKMAARVMDDLVEWNVRNSNYEEEFIVGVMSMLVNPVTYMKCEWAEVMQTIKQRTEEGEIQTHEVVDEVLSGFQALVIPIDELLISNAFQRGIPKQKMLARRRIIDFDTAEGLYGKHDNFHFVTPGKMLVFNEEDETFYEDDDESMQTTVQEVTYYNRREDIEVTFVNGVYLGDDDTSHNMVKHRDNQNAPQYQYVEGGFEPIERFHYYKSLVNKLSNDQKLYDKMWRLSIDGTYLSAMAPITISGDVEVDKSIMIPASVHSMPEETRVTPINVANPSATAGMMAETERSLSQSSQDDSRAGISTQGVQTAFEIAKNEQNARIQLGIAGKQVGSFVGRFGKVHIDMILQHMTVPEISEISGKGVGFKYRKFLLNDAIVDGKKVTKEIRFNDEIYGNEQTIGESLLTEEGGIDSNKRIYMINPSKFSKLKYSIFIEPDALLPKNEFFERAMKLEAYDRAIVDPNANQEAVSRDFLFDTIAPGEADKYMTERRSQVLGANPAATVVKSASKGNGVVEGVAQGQSSLADSLSR